MTITTGCNSFAEGLDIVVEGEAALISDEAKKQRVVNFLAAKYGEDWRFPLDGILFFEVTPTKAFGFGRGEVRAGGPWAAGAHYSQTRWRF